MPHFVPRQITDIFCDDLQFNINFYLKIIGDLFKVIPIDPSTPKSTNRNRPGITGLIQDTMDILPLNEWHAKFADLIDQNEDVRIAIDTVRGNLFKSVATKVRQMEEFNTLTGKMKTLGVPVDCGISLFEKTLNWPYNKCACGNVRVMNEC